MERVRTNVLVLLNGPTSGSDTATEATFSANVSTGENPADSSVEIQQSTIAG